MAPGSGVHPRGRSLFQMSDDSSSSPRGRGDSELRIFLDEALFVVVTSVVTTMLMRTGTKQRNDDRTTNLSAQINYDGNRSANRFLIVLRGGKKCVVGIINLLSMLV